MTIIQTSQNLKSLSDRLWSKVDKRHGDECWLWKGGRYTTPNGSPSYGCISIGSRSDKSKRMVPAHKLVWEIERGPIPAGMKVLHKCDNPQCVRPSHLFLGTQADNVADMISKERAWWQR